MNVAPPLAQTGRQSSHSEYDGCPYSISSIRCTADAPACSQWWLCVGQVPVSATVKDRHCLPLATILARITSTKLWYHQQKQVPSRFTDIRCNNSGLLHATSLRTVSHSQSFPFGQQHKQSGQQRYLLWRQAGVKMFKSTFSVSFSRATSFLEWRLRSPRGYNLFDSERHLGAVVETNHVLQEKHFYQLKIILKIAMNSCKNPLCSHQAAPHHSLQFLFS